MKYIGAVNSLPWSLALSTCFTYALTSLTRGNARLAFRSVAICPARQLAGNGCGSTFAVSMVIYKQPQFWPGRWPTP